MFGACSTLVWCRHVSRNSTEYTTHAALIKFELLFSAFIVTIIQRFIKGGTAQGMQFMEGALLSS